MAYKIVSFPPAHSASLAEHFGQLINTKEVFSKGENILAISDEIEKIEKQYPWQKNKKSDYEHVKRLMPYLERLADDIKKLPCETEKNGAMKSTWIQLSCMRSDCAFTFGDYKKSFEILENLFPASSEWGKAETERVNRIFGMACWQLGKFEKQQFHFEISCKLSKELHGNNSLEYALSIARLAAAYMQRKEYSHALLLLEEALHISAIIPTTEKTAAYKVFILNELGSVNTYLKNFSSAQELLEEAIKIGMEYLDDTFDTIVARAYLGHLHNLQGAAADSLSDYENANTYFERARQLNEYVFRHESGYYHQDHVKIAGAAVRLAMSFTGLHMYKEAIPLLQKGLYINEVLYGNAHLWVEQSLDALIDCLEKALEFYGGYGAHDPDVQKISDDLFAANEKLRRIKTVNQDSENAAEKKEEENHEILLDPVPVVANETSEKNDRHVRIRFPFICGCGEGKKNDMPQKNQSSKNSILYGIRSRFH